VKVFVSDSYAAAPRARSTHGLGLIVLCLQLDAARAARTAADAALEACRSELAAATAKAAAAADDAVKWQGVASAAEARCERLAADAEAAEAEAGAARAEAEAKDRRMAEMRWAVLGVWAVQGCWGGLASSISATGCACWSKTVHSPPQLSLLAGA
jgi:hypothetical protein